MRSIIHKIINGIAARFSNISHRPCDHADSSAQDPKTSSMVQILSHLHGHGLSLETGRPLAADGSPVPWYTYPAIEYFREINADGLDIFEYGCGNSSLFWARKGAHVWSVEHNPQWHSAMMEQASPLQGIMLRETRESYATAVNEPGIDFDLIIIDGIWRNECAAAAIGRLKPGALVILDNSDWYTDVARFLRGRGYFQIDFNGFGPVNAYTWTTSLFLPWQSSHLDRLGQPHPVGGITVARGEQW